MKYLGLQKRINAKVNRETKALVIPRRQVFVKFIDVPSVDESEIEGIAGLQTIKDIPQPRENLVISYRNLGSYREGFSSIMLAVVNKDVVLTKLKEKTDLNIQIESIRLHTELLYLFLLKLNAVARGKVSFLLHIGRKDSEILIMDKARPIFSRGFKNSENFLEEIDRSILAYKRTRDNPEIQDIIVAYPSDVDIKDAIPHIKSHFTIPVNFYEYSEDLGSVDVAAEIDLIPKEISHKKTRLEKRKELIITYSLVGLAVMLLSYFLYYKIYEKNTLLAKFSERKTEITSRIQGLDEFLKKTEVVKKHIERGDFIARVLEESYILIPGDITISGLDYNGGDSIFYKGTAEDMPLVFSFVKKLEGAGYFEKVEVKHATKKRARGKEFTEFNIQCGLKL